MAIGRSFEETIQKAVRMVSPGLDGLHGNYTFINENRSLDEQLRCPTDQRLFSVMKALETGYTVDRVHDLSKIDKWFLSKLARIATLNAEIKTKSIQDLTQPQFRLLKSCGFSDKTIAMAINSTEPLVRQRRVKFNVTPCVKQIDTLAAEFPSSTNYLYMSYNGTEDDIEFNGDGVIVLGCGAYCIGSSVEFDWCAVSAVRTLRELGHQSIVINYNPETVSTDYDESDRLYFEEISLERTMDIYERELAAGIIVSVGGQIPNNLAMDLDRQGVNILGTSADSIDRC